MVHFVLFESALGYALFERLQSEEIGAKLEQVQKSVEDLVKFGKIVKLRAFMPFKNAAHALENINDISEGVVHTHLKTFLEMNLLPLISKGGKTVLGVLDKTLAGSIKSSLGIECDSSELVLELVRGIRLHSDKMLDQVKAVDLEKAQLGLGHSYSRAKVKFNVNRTDNMIIQAIALLDQLDKNVNTFAMRIREWYSWHFPELVKIVNDNYQYVKLARFIKDKNELTEEQMDGLVEITGDESKAKQILDAARASMGTDISELDMINIEHFTERLIKLADYRKKMHEYLLSKMHNVAPNLSALIGEIVGARLISHAGSLTNLSKYPASTVQILGAEKALFRALKTKGNTPKYGLLYHSSFIGRAGAKNKGKISRFLANKCTIASRIDCFADKPTSKFGEALKGQVEERLSFYERGSAVSKNIEVISKVMRELDEEMEMDVDKESSEVVLGKRKASPELEEMSPKKHKQEEEADDAETSKSTKKKKNKKKNKKDSDTPKKTPKLDNKDKFVLQIPSDIEEDEDTETPKSKKKKEKKEEVTPIKKKDEKDEVTPKKEKEKKEKKDEVSPKKEKEKKEKKKKDEKDEVTPTKKKGGKGEEALTQETPKSDKKKKDKKGEVTATNETPKSDKKKDKKSQKKEQIDPMEIYETPELDKKKKKKNK